MSPPAVAIFDVNETLSDLQGLVARLEELGASAAVLSEWFAATLRDGFAVTAAGGYADFASIAVPTLAAMLASSGAGGSDPAEAAEHIVAGMGELDLHPDVEPGLRALAEAGVRVMTLSNGAAGVAESLLERAGLRGLVQDVLSVSDAGRWKPAAAAYAYAAEHCGADPGEMMLIAVHPWDIDGARRAGVRTGWITRDGATYPPFMRPAEIVGADLPAIVAAMVEER